MKTTSQVVQDRIDWTKGWAKMMLTIWKEQMRFLHVRDKGNLYNSLAEVSFYANDPVYEIFHKFLDYGIYIDRGTGKEIPIGNPGDLGFTPTRKPQKWFSVKHYASTMAMMEYMKDSMGDEFIASIVNVLKD